jgi:hypothetical protein
MNKSNRFENASFQQVPVFFGIFDTLQHHEQESKRGNIHVGGRRPKGEESAQEGGGGSKARGEEGWEIRRQE